MSTIRRIFDRWPMVVIALSVLGSVSLSVNLAMGYNDYDNPCGVWNENTGELTQTYRFGSTVANPSKWRTAWVAGTLIWESSDTDTAIDWTENSYAPTTFNRYSLADGKEGFSQPYCSGGYLSSTDNWLNEYYDIAHNHTADQRRAIAAHEIGHASGMGHSNTAGALMEGANTDQFPTSTQQDDNDGIDDLYN